MAGRAGGSRDDIQEPDPEKRSVKLCFVIIGSPVATPGRGRQGEDQEQGKGQLLEGATPGPGKARIIATVVMLGLGFFGRAFWPERFGAAGAQLLRAGTGPAAGHAGTAISERKAALKLEVGSWLSWARLRGQSPEPLDPASLQLCRALKLCSL